MSLNNLFICTNGKPWSIEEGFDALHTDYTITSNIINGDTVYVYVCKNCGFKFISAFNLARDNKPVKHPALLEKLGPIVGRQTFIISEACDQLKAAINNDEVLRAGYILKRLKVKMNNLKLTNDIIKIVREINSDEKI